MVGAQLLETGIDPKFLSQTDDLVKNFLHVIGGSNIVFTDDSDTRAQLVAVGLWTDISVRVLKLPGCEQLFVEMLGGGENWILNRSFLKTVRHSVLREMPVIDYVKIHLSVVQVRYGN